MSAAMINDPKSGSPEYQAFVNFAVLTAEKRDLAERIRDIESELRALEATLLSYLGENGYELVRVQGFTISPHREPWIYPAKGQTRDSVCRALKACGLGRFVKEGYSTRSLTKYIRELEEHSRLLADGDADPAAALKILPEGLSVVLEIKPGYRLQVLDRRKG